MCGLKTIVNNNLSWNNLEPKTQVRKVALGDDPPFSTIVDYYFNKAAPFAEEAISNQIAKTKMSTELKGRLVSVRERLEIILGLLLRLHNR